MGAVVTHRERDDDAMGCDGKRRWGLGGRWSDTRDVSQDKEAMPTSLENREWEKRERFN
jgi:hypothetical protein